MVAYRVLWAMIPCALMCKLLLVGFSAVIAVGTPAFADGGLEYEAGGLFRRKGWVHPEIFRKPKKPAPKPAESRTAPVRVASLGNTQRRPKRAQRNPRRAVPKAVARAANRRAKADSARGQRSRTRRAKRPMARAAPNPKPRPKAVATPKAAPEPIKVASLGNIPLPKPLSRPKPSVTGPALRIVWAANSKCLTARLRRVVSHVARNFGKVRVNSTCRSRRHNRRVGGASRSYHLNGRAVDFRVYGRIRAAARYLRSLAGGYKHYGGGLFHIDTGPKRRW